MRPTIAMTAGLHGSASTWVFNVARELAVAAFGAEQVFAGYLEEPGPIPSGRAFVLVKSHHGSAELDRWMDDHGARTIVSIRDPRDAALSMVRRFQVPLATAAYWLANDCTRILRLIEAGHPALRYEDRFFDDPGTVRLIAERLELPVPDGCVRTIFDRYRTETLRQWKLETVDPVTQIWPNHIGDATSGNWRSLPPPEREGLNRMLAPYAQRFSYPGA